MDWKVVAVWAAIGIVAGWLASLVVGGRGSVRYLITGLSGAVVGGFLAQQFNISPNLGNEIVDHIVIATPGAIIVALLARRLF